MIGIFAGLKAAAGLFGLFNKIADALRFRRERAAGRLEGERDHAIKSVELQKDMAKADGAGPRTRDDVTKRLSDGSF